MEIMEKENKKEKIKKIIKELLKYNLYFCTEFLNDEKEVQEFEKSCKEAEEADKEEKDEPVFLCSASENNMRLMKRCMRETVQVINYLNESSNLNYIELWQIAGAEAILKQCNEDGIIPYDLPAVFCTLFMCAE